MSIVVKATSDEFNDHVVAHHFDSKEQEFESAQLGMWLFLGQELLFFSALFVAYAVFKLMYPAMFSEGASHLQWQMGALNTVFLITSSFTMVMGVRSAQMSKRKSTVVYLSLTLLLATLFLVVKYFEYSAKIHHGYVPSRWFTGIGEHDTLPLFFGLYFFMTGLHGLHVLVGMFLLAWMIFRAHRGDFFAEHFTCLEMVGLYWHLVDLIWIFLFPLLYLV